MPEQHTKVDRRNLTEGVAIDSDAQAMAVHKLPQKWDREADVIIVGYGFAGVAAAIVAHDAGARVLILEKAPEKYKGGNSRVSGNGIFWPDDIEKAKIYFTAMSGAHMDHISDEMLHVWAVEMHANRAWLEKLGWEPFRYGGAEFPDLPGADCVYRFLHRSGPVGEARLWYDVTEPAMAARNIQTLYETPVFTLLRREAEIAGVVAERNGKRINVRANRAIILACGGFENNETMIRDYVNHIPRAATMGTPYNTGDGIRMAVEVGADLWHMDNVAGPAFLFKAPDQPVATMIRMPAPNFILVGKDGTRFVAEGDPLGMSNHGKILRNGRWVPMPCPLPVFLVFDETFRAGGGIGGKPAGWTMGWDFAFGLYDWSGDNGREIQKGWIKKASTIRELAAAMNLSPDALDGTVGRYNGFARESEDRDFARAPRSLGMIQTPPFYAMELTPTFLNTQGGPRRNKDAQIVDADSKPIPRLYSAGELGSIYGFRYNGGGNLGECIAFGRIAGGNAARLEPWTAAPG
jgi:succinate dehydrogenase/fumarate reductase flavoprotein subunit